MKVMAQIGFRAHQLSAIGLVIGIFEPKRAKMQFGNNLETPLPEIRIST